MQFRTKLGLVDIPNDEVMAASRDIAGSAASTSESAAPSGAFSVAGGSGSVSSAGFFRKFQKGDSVFHRPTGETWSLIADEKDGWVTPGGWPPSQGRAEDCKLVERGRQAEDESVRQPSPNAEVTALSERTKERSD